MTTASATESVTSQSVDVLTFGESLITVRADGPLSTHQSATISMAGAESNVAIGLSRLGHSVRWLGLVGDDEPGALVLRTLRAEAMDVSGARVDRRGTTGLLVSEPRTSEITRVTYYRAGSAASHLEPADVVPALASPPKVLHVTGITCALGSGPRAAVSEAVSTASARGVTVSLDVNYRSRLWTREQAAEALTELVPHIDVLIASDDELELVAGGDSETAQVSALLDRGVSELVVTRGAAGATVFTRDEKISSPARPVRVVDVIGAGDAFVSGYLSARLDGLDVPHRLARAIATASFVVACAGDWEGLPTRADLSSLNAADSTIR
ncbi:sugar kinase [Phytoactinopolyspora alkaliphila]|uniref:Sugar kinase n=1 Tax=Phytoactinopolyspora alkaliphila TaxID=1783498 RepID=A0A6N9YTU5_9ACTN|nr:sugar kinase [Phytoactinopolyspora alkaliphila]